MRIPICSLLLMLPVAASAMAQHSHAPASGAASPAAAEAFVEAVQSATRRFHDLGEAIAAGYRLVGPDMPGMGEHWVHPRRALDPAVDPARPSILTYIRVSDRPVLTGVAYAAPVMPGGEPPPAPAPGATWHYHAGTIEHVLRGGHPAGSGQSVRLAMIHAWVWTENPDGLFAPDNWALSFVRLGREVPEQPTPDASRALFLLSGGAGYYAQRVAAAGVSAESASAAGEALAKHRQRIAALPRDAPPATLEAAWKALWREVRARLSEADWRRVEPLAQ